jgi:hypothetical protein
MRDEFRRTIDLHAGDVDLDRVSVLFSVEQSWLEPDMGVGDPGGWIVSCRLESLRVGGLEIGREQVRDMIGSAYMRDVEEAEAERHRAGLAYGDWAAE